VLNPEHLETVQSEERSTLMESRSKKFKVSTKRWCDVLDFYFFTCRVFKHLMNALNLILFDYCSG
jgi:hypothetical protein